MKDRLLKGTLILTLATIISKVLGFIYVIPFTALVGVQGNILFEYAYKPYAIMLSISTLGIPLAISKFVSKYEEKGQRGATQKLFRASLFFMTITGLIAFLMLYQFAPNIAGIVTNQSEISGNSIEDITHVIRLVSFALLIIAPMSVIRGYFQGLGDMRPTAISQVIEQVIRLGFILIMAVSVIKWQHGTIKEAVGWATFAAFIGGMASLIYLTLVYIQFYKKGKTKSKDTTTLAYRKIFTEIIKDAIPFAIISLAIPLYQLIETFTMNQSLVAAGLSQIEAETQNSLISLSQKLVLIPVSLATAFGITLIPEITKSVTAKDQIKTKTHIMKTIKVILWMVLPLTLVIMVAAEPIFGAMFGTDYQAEGGALLRYYAPTILVYSLYIVTAAMLQGMNHHGYAIASLFIGVIIKLSANAIMIKSIGTIGTIMTTDIGFIISIFINVWVISHTTGVEMKTYFKQERSLVGVCLAFIIAALLLCGATTSIANTLSLSESASSWLICVGVGAPTGIAYLYLFRKIKRRF